MNLILFKFYIAVTCTLHQILLRRSS